MKIILHGEVELDRMAKAATAALDYLREHGFETPKLLGLKIDGVYWSVKFNKASISVWRN